ncbi:ABC transporter ATP-binding protein [Pseudosulfitobacter pseudonitzschiae]|uniref:ABC transporter ATP-binding protein n=1 Tax=Pseudosulfitobacter pseudonitzschiae TaxID=1402135 RepID=A0A073JBU5_9RHOB|nr:ABC transporter ATP-binding protein [Pseudosulfitobacter pseudonitzschiae]KEJ95207.1 ABC transporter ATP-binding protein [Pseudosulfitobacter pseudonitzschiae]MBM1816760.1 ABC transporter ATP-binding protein [Pseudosulfitobacter pseudonitzschiae]MBM1833570.1 ABC transporter ATP-binding protein [Pseudosulfitobacter pseudonitzschiae]MBM1838437.1 ABC transporter ATP-binding protein [Pseudosulfitobacter pseudonitzschiae]MBM1843487.1 ABC transporter ATP-binding protein [Pseudosulfitobacter pseud
MSLLSTHGLLAGYGDMRALHGIDFAVDPGETVALIGANGAGKSTLLRAIMGLLPVAAEMVQFDGKPVGGTAPHRMVQSGVAIVPEGRRLFSGMTVEENLRVASEHAAAPHNTPWTQERVYDLFPILREKARTPVENLSGGQQQMVSIGRGLLAQPRVLLCDEISLGLAPRVVREIYAALPQVTAQGTALVLVEQDVGLAKQASQRLYCLLEGRVTLEGQSSDISRDDISAAYFGASHALD